MEETYTVVLKSGSIGGLTIDQAERIQRTLLREFGLSTERFSETTVKPRAGTMSKDDAAMLKEYANELTKEVPRNEPSGNQ